MSDHFRQRSTAGKWQIPKLEPDAELSSFSYLNVDIDNGFTSNVHLASAPDSSSDVSDSTSDGYPARNKLYTLENIQINEFEFFEHAPLDHQKASLRLVRVLNTPSPEGYIQCEVRHTSIDDSYICLSYVWGEQDRGHMILLDNKLFRVRENLYDFLVIARKKTRLQSEWLFVDALCIDQTDIEERNHQVQQMGLVYSRAKEVMSWFGNNYSIASCFQWNQYISNVELAYSEYWRRAWITQEVALARKVTLCAEDKELDFALLNCNDTLSPPAIRTLSPKQTRTLKGRSLIYLIDMFDKACHDRRDRIYSLLALCGDGSDLRVDYNSSLVTLAKKTLRSCKRSFCLCAIRIVEFATMVGEDHQGSKPGLLEMTEPFAYLTLPLIQGDPDPTQHICAGVWKKEDCKGQHSPGFVALDLATDVWLVLLYPHSFCESSTDLRIYVTIEIGMEGTTWCAIKSYGHAEITIESGQDSGCTLLLTNDTCEVYFTFDLLTKIGQFMTPLEPCERVTLQGTEDEKYVSEPVLRLCQ